MYTFDCELIYLPPNMIDIAIFRIKDFNTSYDLVPIKYNNDKVTLLQEVYAVNYSYFYKQDVLRFKTPFYFVINQ
jgi:hypothetical protein